MRWIYLFSIQVQLSVISDGDAIASSIMMIIMIMKEAENGSLVTLLDQLIFT